MGGRELKQVDWRTLERTVRLSAFCTLMKDGGGIFHSFPTAKPVSGAISPYARIAQCCGGYLIDFELIRNDMKRLRAILEPSKALNPRRVPGRFD